MGEKEWAQRQEDPGEWRGTEEGVPLSQIRASSQLTGFLGSGTLEPFERQEEGKAGESI